MVRIHNRPAYNSECHATREMGIGELNNSATRTRKLADCIMAIGGNPYETQTNYFSPTGCRTFRVARCKKRKPLPGRDAREARDHLR